MKRINWSRVDTVPILISFSNLRPRRVHCALLKISPQLGADDPHFEKKIVAMAKFLFAAKTVAEIPIGSLSFCLAMHVETTSA